VLPDSAVPVTVTDVTFVVPSLVDVPVSVAVVRAGVAGAAGAVVSRVTDSVPALLALPAASVAVKLSAYTPSTREAFEDPRTAYESAPPVAVRLAVFNVNDAESFVAVAATVEPLSAVTDTTGVTLVIRSPDVPLSVLVSAITGALGAVVSMMIVWPVCSADACNAGSVRVALFPAASAIVPVNALVDW
jgi:hypothetical protein